MDLKEAVGVALAAVMFVGIVYWAVIGPRREQRERRRALGAPGRFAQAWDPRVYSGRRNR